MNVSIHITNVFLLHSFCMFKCDISSIVVIDIISEMVMNSNPYSNGMALCTFADSTFDTMTVNMIL